MTRKRDATLASAIRSAIKKNRQKKFPGYGGQKKCAENFGADRAKWSKWENGLSVPSDTEQRRLAAFFGISMAELRGESPALVGAGAVKASEESRLLVIELLRIQEEVAVLSRGLLAAEFSDVDALEAALQGPLQRLRDAIGRARAAAETRDRDSQVS